MEKPVIGSDGNPVLDGDGNTVVETVNPTPEGSRALIAENEKQQLFDREILLLCEHDSLRERVDDLAEPQALEHAAQLGADWRSTHRAPPSFP